MRKLSAAFALILVTMLTPACSVDHTPVENRPPAIDNSVSQFGSSFGIFKLDIASVFLWPAGVDGPALSKLVAGIAKLSAYADFYGLQTVLLRNEIAALENRWDAVDCVGNYAVLLPGQDEIDPGHISEWKPVSDKADLDLVSECIANQSTREAKVNAQNEASEKARGFIKQISLALDPDQTNVQNMKKLEATKSRLSIVDEDGALKVHVTLGDFLFAGHSPSTDLSDEDRANPESVRRLLITNATYDLKWRLLKFDVPEVDVDNQTTGRIYKFAVERTKDRGPMSRFTGEMNLTENGVIVRHGMARFDAALPVSAESKLNH